MNLVLDHFYLFPKANYEAVTKTQPASFPVSNTSINLLSELLDRSPPSAEKLQVELWSERTGFRLQFISNRTYILRPISCFAPWKAVHGRTGLWC